MSGSFDPIAFQNIMTLALTDFTFAHRAMPASIMHFLHAATLNHVPRGIRAVYRANVRIRNCERGLLADISITWTKHLLLFEICTLRSAEYLQLEDLLEFQRINDDPGIGT